MRACTGQTHRRTHRKGAQSRAKEEEPAGRLRCSSTPPNLYESGWTVVFLQAPPSNATTHMVRQRREISAPFNEKRVQYTHMYRGTHATHARTRAPLAPACRSAEESNGPRAASRPTIPSRRGAPPSTLQPVDGRTDGRTNGGENAVRQAGTKQAAGCLLSSGLFDDDSDEGLRTAQRLHLCPRVAQIPTQNRTDLPASKVRRLSTT